MRTTSFMLLFGLNTLSVLFSAIPRIFSATQLSIHFSFWFILPWFRACVFKKYFQFYKSSHYLCNQSEAFIMGDNYYYPPFSIDSVFLSELSTFFNDIFSLDLRIFRSVIVFELSEKCSSMSSSEKPSVSGRIKYVTMNASPQITQ